MSRGVKIPKCKKNSITDKIIKYPKPKFVYIPLICQNDINITVLVKNGDYVYKGDIIARKRGNFKIPIHASVSGTVTSIIEKPYLNGKLVKCVVIKNDFKERMSSTIVPRKHINDYTKDEFIDKIRDCGIVGLGGGGFPTFAKYDTDAKINTLIVNAIECEPYITADYMLLQEKCEEILEVIDAVIEINDIPEAIIAISRANTKTKEVINTFIGTYLKIKLVEVPNLYPMGWERTLIKEIKGITYNKIPAEKGIIVNNVSTMFAIYEALKYDKPLIERVVTITGEMIKEPQNILIKTGTPINEIIESIGGYKRFKDIYFIAGGPMMGTSIETDEMISSSNLTSVLVIRNNSEQEAIECLRCGKCVDVCPAKLSPVLIINSLETPEKLKSLRPEKCVECGLCSYICPSKIKVRDFVIEGKKIND
ncbi:MAG: RnfABCDGE type electron transport complex subunit C [Bacilli bacterium]|nr:RnfABCDGE type electron transport complex subunit C [Bacilli bacterium]MDD4718505.1 RnfABCDGE type electron transport complex subunit C [Bacilli bacterium]